MLKIRKNTLNSIQVGRKKKDLAESIINDPVYFLEFDRNIKYCQSQYSLQSL